MAVVQTNMKISPRTRELLRKVKEEMRIELGREITYSEVIERLAALYRAGVSQP